MFNSMIGTSMIRCQEVYHRVEQHNELRDSSANCWISEIAGLVVLEQSVWLSWPCGKRWKTRMVERKKGLISSENYWLEEGPVWGLTSSQFWLSSSTCGSWRDVPLPRSSHNWDFRPPSWRIPLARVCCHIWRRDIEGGSSVPHARPTGSLYTAKLPC